ncbi:MAG TPA: SymE family type I addiction module toxin [Thermoanaerobaculia bacterium]|nr:SymE family type I addiction module toxin [Thermoanaerobaculia bacterium]
MRRGGPSKNATACSIVRWESDMPQGENRSHQSTRHFRGPVSRRASRRGGGGGKRELVVSSISQTERARFRRRLRVVPYIRLSGQWLERLGFARGCRLEVTSGRKRIVLTVVEEDGWVPVRGR